MEERSNDDVRSVVSIRQPV